MIKIIYINTLNIGVSYWRIENYANTMVQFKDDCAVHVEYFFDPRLNIPWDKLIYQNTEEMENIRDKLDAIFQFYDIIIFQKIQGMPLIEFINELRKKYPKPRLLMECDDSIGDITPSNVGIDKITDEHSVAAIHAQISDGVITTTEYLANELKLFNKNVYIAPNCIDPSSWRVNEYKYKKESTFNISYVAGGGHDEDLLIAYRSIEPLLESSNIKFKIRYGGSRPVFLKHHKKIDFKTVNYTLDIYPQKLYDLKSDLALAPLRDTSFNRCKSNIKFLEWAYIGVTTLASNVDPYKKTKGNIFLSSNDINDFSNNIKEIISGRNKVFDPKLLKDNLIENYNIKTETKKILQYLKSIL